MGARFKRNVKTIPRLTLTSINTKGQQSTSIGIPEKKAYYIDGQNQNAYFKAEGETGEEVEKSQNLFRNQRNLEIKIKAAKKLKAKYSNKTLKRFSIIFKCLGVLLVVLGLMLCLVSLFALLFVGYGIFTIYQGDFYSKMVKGYYDM